MDQALQVSRFSDDSGKGHRAKGIENIRIPLIPYLPGRSPEGEERCSMHYAQSFKQSR